jgi:glycine dehydrogenase
LWLPPAASEAVTLAELRALADRNRPIVLMMGEIDKVAAGEWPQQDKPLRNVPHTAACAAAADWTHSYRRDKAVFPPSPGRVGNYPPPVRQVAQAGGDRNLVCACPPAASYQN